MKGAFLITTALLAVCIFGGAVAEIDVNQINVNDLQQNLPPELANSNFTMEDAKKLLRDKCVEVAGKEAGEAAYANIEEASTTLVDCVSGLVNQTIIQKEIEEASPRGELDVVFNKYCNKRPAALTCIDDFNSKFVPCLDKDERENQDVFMRIVRSLLDFVCHKGGDQIALFIAEKGPECLESKKDDIQQCINNTFSGYVPKDGLENIKSLPKLVMGPKQCEEMLQLERCIVDKLEKCSEITPANIVESMFRFIKNETICRNTPRVAKQSAASGGASTMLQLSGTIWALTCTLFYAAVKRLQT